MSSQTIGRKKIRSFDDLSALSGRGETVVTLCGGGLDSIYLLSRLREFDVRVVALAVDLGDDFDELHFAPIVDKLGIEFLRLDRREEFAGEFVGPSILAGATYLGQHPVSASLSRPLIARTGVDFAREIGAGFLLHTANQSQNSLRRLNGAIEDLGFEGYYGSPYEFDALHRDYKRAELEACGIDGFTGRRVSTDTNLWCREFESGSLEDPEDFTVEESLYSWSCRSASRECQITVGFEHGELVSVDGAPVPSLATAVERLNTLVGGYGIGRYTSLEHLGTGEKVLEVREAPAAALLIEAFRHAASATVGADILAWASTVGNVWVQEAVEGRWFRHLRTASEAFLKEISAPVTGTVHLQLRPGAVDLVGLKAQRPLYVRDRERWEYVQAAEESMRTSWQADSLGDVVRQPDESLTGCLRPADEWHVAVPADTHAG